MSGPLKKLPASFATDPFVELYHSSKHPKEKIRFLALCMLQQGGRTNAQVAALLHVSCVSVSKWLRRYREGGIEGLRQQGGQGSKRLLSSRHPPELQALVQQLSQQQSGGRVMGKQIHQELQRQTGKSFHLNSVYRWLHEAGMSWVTSRSRHPQSTPKVQQEFKKKIPSSRSGGRGQQS